MTNEMVERVARELAKLITEPGRHPDSQMVHCTFLARAAIAAMREPTEAMAKAAYPEIEDSVYKDETVHEDVPEVVWRAMIDEALKPGSR